MIVYVDKEHQKFYDSPAGEMTLARRLKIKYRLEDISGEPCLIVRYNQANPDLLQSLGARAVLVSGCWTEIQHYAEADLAGLRAIYRVGAWPTLSFCAGFQVMAQTFGAEIGPIGPLTPNRPKPANERVLVEGLVQGVKHEVGFKPIRVLAPHPLLTGLDEAPVFFQVHYWEVKSVPDGFRLYAETDVCGVQMIAHESLPLYGTQFHPERYEADYPAGRRVLANFFKLVGLDPNLG